MAGLSHSHRERQEQEELMSTRELASYLGQFSYVVPSKAELEATTGIAEVLLPSDAGTMPQTPPVTRLCPCAARPHHRTID